MMKKEDEISRKTIWKQGDYRIDKVVEIYNTKEETNYYPYEKGEALGEVFDTGSLKVASRIIKLNIEPNNFVYGDTVWYGEDDPEEYIFLECNENDWGRPISLVEKKNATYTMYPSHTPLEPYVFGSKEALIMFHNDIIDDLI